MKKIIPCLIIFLFIIQGIQIIPGENQEKTMLNEQIHFPSAHLKTNETTIIQINDSLQYAKQVGDVLRPMISKTFTFPFGTQIKDITVTFTNPKTIQLPTSLSLKPSPYTINHDAITITSNKKRTVNYEATFYSTIDTGISKNNRVVYVTLYLIPVSYISDAQQVIFYNQADVTIEKTLPANQINFPDIYDMVIIAPESFASTIQPLIEHKNSIGIQTMFQSCESVYANYPGVDAAEQIKYFIKDAIESYGIEYVFLIGGRSGGIMEEKWHIPVRYSHLNDGGEGSFISDLYYADIYDETGEFADWDPDGNGIFAQWKGFRKDNIGLIPDVSVGRLPCTTNQEVAIMIEKIITYETTNKDAWFYDMVVVGGDSAHIDGDIYNEGEEENKQALLYMDEFNGIHCWTSDETFTTKEDVMNAIKPGCGFLFFDGHASPARWSTHPPQQDDIWIEGPDVFDMPDLQNGNKFPVCVVGGCHIAQFNVSLFNILKGIIDYGIKGYFFQSPFKFYYMEWVPKCWSWQLASMKEGGSIATLGFTGLDWFAIGDFDEDGIPDCTQYYSGFMNTHFFKNYGQNNITILGKTHTQTIIDFINTHPPMENEMDCKTVEEWALLGDPSLHVVSSL